MLSRHKAWILISLSLIIHLIAFVLARHKVEPIYTQFYSLAWWTYIFFLAGINHLRARNSLMLDRPKEALWVFFYSSLVWFFFEIYNLRVNNWYYLFIPIEKYLRWPGYFIAYGTVLPGLFETETLLRNLGVLSRVQSRHLKVGPALLFRFVVLGVLMMIAVLILPDLFFPLVWLGLIFILDPVVYRSRDRDASLLHKAEQGDYSLVLRLLITGLVCGVLWEFWNHWSGAKWVYNIPHFNFLKMFEMPLLGFLGFPPFTLECYLLYRVFLLFRERFIYRRTLAPMVTLILVIAYCVLAILGIDRLTIVSYKVMVGTGT